MINHRIDAAFERKLLSIKKDKPDTYTALKNYQAINKIKEYLNKEVQDYIAKRAKRGIFEVSDIFLDRTMHDCFGFVVYCMERHYDLINETKAAKDQRLAADQKRKDIEASAGGRLSGEYKELEGLIHFGGEQDANKEKSDEQGQG